MGGHFSNVPKIFKTDKNHIYFYLTMGPNLSLLCHVLTYAPKY